MRFYSQFKNTALSAALTSALAFSTTHAGSLTGGDSPDQASADAVLDIIFAIDTSSSMSDEASGISNATNNIVQNLNCSNLDVWVRARFIGISGTFSNTLFDEDSDDYITANGGTTIVNSSEDNGPVVEDLSQFNDLVDDTTASQRYVKAIVTIGDEGTENGSPVTTEDYAAALSANTAAIGNNFIVFSLLGNNPSTGAADVFRFLAEGGQANFDGQTFNFADTGGTFTETSSNTLESDIEAIICGAVAPPTPGPTNIPTLSEWAMILTSFMLAGLAALRIRRKD